MAEFSLNPNYVEMLGMKIRALMGKEPADEDEGGSNPTDDEGAGLLMEAPGDLTRSEIESEIRGLSREEQAELIALMWFGRDDSDEEEWPELLAQARDRRDVKTSTYLLDEPLVADYWDEALDKLGIRSGADDVEEI